MRFLKTLAAAALYLAASTAMAGLQPFVMTYDGVGDVASKAAETKSALEGPGFTIAGAYQPYAGTEIIVVTSDTLKQNAAKSEMGGYGAVQRISVTKVGDNVQVAFTNPVYWAAAFRLAGDNAAVRGKLEAALGKGTDFGTPKDLSADDLRGYHYTLMMEYFDDPSEMAEFDSYEEGVKIVEKSLAAGLGSTAKVYRVDIPGKDETVFGVALKGTDAEDCSSDEFIMSRIDKEPMRSAAHLPYELLVSGDKAYALYGRFRIAISLPHLPMMASETGATFMSIMCSPDAIEEALIQAAGEEP